MKQPKKDKYCCGCNNWTPDEFRCWVYGGSPTRGVCSIVGVYREGNQTCDNWDRYEAPMSLTQKALWELSHYCGWTDAHLAELFKEKEEYVTGCLKAITENHALEVKAIHTAKLRKLNIEMALHSLPLASAYIQ